MKVNVISKKTVRNKDYKAIIKQVPGYCQFEAPNDSVEHRGQVLYRTTRGWFLLYSKGELQADGKRKVISVVGEISIPAAQQWLLECNIPYRINW